MRSFLLGVVALSLLVGTGMGRSDEEAVPTDKIPKAVTDALFAKFPKAKIENWPSRSFKRPNSKRVSNIAAMFWG